MINVFIGTRDKVVACKVSADVKSEIKKRVAKLGLTKTNDYLLTLIDKDLRESEK